MKNACYHLQGPFIAMSVLLIAIAERSALAGQALNQFLAGQIAPEVHEFGEIQMTRADISGWLQKLRTAKQPQERGVAVANLQNCAWVLLDTPETLPAALELLDRWVIPNAALLRSKPRTSACSWENVVQGAYACYKKAGDPHGERRALELLSTQARDPGLRDLATLRLAGLKASQGSLREAIDIARKSDAKGELAEPRAKLLQSWQERLKPKKATQ
jgi:hypothetical protein